MVVQLVDTVIFSAGAAAAGWALWSSVSPQWERIAHLALGRPDPMASPLGQLARAEQRIAVRARVTVYRPSAAWREAA